MKIGTHSEKRLKETLNSWNVPDDYANPIYNYLVHGLDPGSFFRAVLANDFFKAVQSSHPSNSIPALKRTVNWIKNHIPSGIYGSHEAVNGWLELDNEERRSYLEQLKVIFTEKEETWMTLKNEPIADPYDF